MLFAEFLTSPRGLADAARMLAEIHEVKQEPGRRRRWFEDEALELIVWYDAGEAVDGFQLCYVAGGGERALTWRRARGFTHARIESGDTSPLKNQTPILQPDGEVPWPVVEQRFRERSGLLDFDLREMIGRRLSAKG